MHPASVTCLRPVPVTRRVATAFAVSFFLAAPLSAHAESEVVRVAVQASTRMIEGFRVESSGRGSLTYDQGVYDQGVDQGVRVLALKMGLPIKGSTDQGVRVLVLKMGQGL